MTAPTSIRLGRADLAEVLMAAGRYGEAERELQAARSEQGDDPSAAELLARLAAVAAAQHDTPTALAYLWEALLGPNASSTPGSSAPGSSAPGSSADGPTPALRAQLAGEALALIEGTDGYSLVSRLPTRQVQALLELAQASDAPAELARLALRVAYLRRESSTTEVLLASPSLATDPAAAATRSLESAWSHLEHGEADLALEALSGLGSNDRDAAPARAFAHYVRGELDAVEGALADAAPSYLAVVVRTLTLLRRAAGAVEPDRSAIRRDALASADESARTEGADASETVLLRAQATLEAGTDLVEGRRLLAGFLRRRRDPSDVRWWRVQRAVRHDDPFTFICVEVGGAQDSDDVLAMIDALPLAKTVYLQDGAIAERLADAHRRRGEIDAAVARYVDAARFYQMVQPAPAVEQIVEVYERRNSIQPSPTGAMDLAEALWQRSYVADRTPQAQADDLTAGLAALDASPLSSEPTDLARGVYLRGLLLARRAEGEPRPSMNDRWLTIPWLLVATLTQPSEAYCSAHLAWALDSAGLQYQAFRFAERASALDKVIGGDVWLQQAAIGLRFNWFGGLDPATAALLDSPKGDQAWNAGVKLYAALMRGDLEEARRLTDASVTDKDWAQSLAAVAAAQIGQLDRAREAFAALFTQQVSAGDHQGAAELAMALGRLDDAREHLRLAVERGLMAPASRDFESGLVELLAGAGPAPVEAMYAWLGAQHRPGLLLDLIHLRLPVLAAMYPNRADLFPVFQVLALTASARVSELQSMALPALTDDVEPDRSAIVEPARRTVVFDLLDLAEAIELDDHDRACSRLAQLSTVLEPRLAAALATVSLGSSHEGGVGSDL